MPDIDREPVAACIMELIMMSISRSDIEIYLWKSTLTCTRVEIRIEIGCPSIAMHVMSTLHQPDSRLSSSCRGITTSTISISSRGGTVLARLQARSHMRMCGLDASTLQEF